MPRATLTSALATMIAPHAFIVAAGIAFPVLAPLAAPDIGFDRAYVGLFSAANFGVAGIAVLFGALFVDRVGPIRAMQFCAISGVLALVTITTGQLWLLPLAALFAGLGYAPPNPASSPLLLALAPPERRSSIFSLKQVSVPLGGAVAGFLLPPLAAVIGWQGALWALATIGLVIACAIAPWRSPFDTITQDAASGTPGANAPHHAFKALLRAPRLRAIGAMCFGFAALQYTFSSVFVVFLVTRAKLDVVDAGALLGLGLFVSIFMRVVWGLLADRLGDAAVLLILGVVMAGAAFTSVIVTSQWSFYALGLLAMVFAGAAYSWNGVFLAAVATVAGPERIADATSSTMSLVFAGGLSGPLIYSLIVWLTGDVGLGFGVLGLLALSVGVWVSWVLARGAAARTPPSNNV
ncbi:MAG: MFS transporter [Pseudomonadota bacterium]